LDNKHDRAKYCLLRLGLVLWKKNTLGWSFVTGERRAVYKGKRPIGISSRWEDYIKMDIKDLGSRDVAWIDLAEYTDKWRALVQVVMNILVP
jgi:hypothetical protein